ncbi:hypothetical protein [Acidovorax sp. ACV01]|uniref:hypothetical protein n=1 Tax=Acidovorax sp. ACV01 TaxID=2769311 RepID=UPI00177C1047|nr:hypothetical protein [Acidovorax sp. ACV01]MBD9395746.1 hypothetical protein [Acidovorax sp. ACV01]
MIETCLKCGHVNNASTGNDSEACPQCGAIYSKVEMAQRQSKPEAPGFEARYNSLEQNITKRTGLGMGAWMLVLMVAIPIVWLSTTQERKPRPGPDAQRAREAMEAIATAQQDRLKQAILERRVLIGMTAAQAREAWGKPSSINRTESAYGAREQWVYGIGDYVYLRNDVVESVQTSRRQQ